MNEYTLIWAFITHLLNHQNYCTFLASMMWTADSSSIGGGIIDTFRTIIANPELFFVSNLKTLKTEQWDSICMHVGVSKFAPICGIHEKIAHRLSSFIGLRYFSIIYRNRYRYINVPYKWENLLMLQPKLSPKASTTFLVKCCKLIWRFSTYAVWYKGKSCHRKFYYPIPDHTTFI